MKTEGGKLTRKMANRVRNPFGRNKGKGLTLKKIAKYIEAGADAIEADKEVNEQIVAGMKKVGA